MITQGPDIRELLESWPYDPQNNVRAVEFVDGRAVLQVRLPFGIEQYERDGRPDGKRPYGVESVLHYHLSRLKRARSEGKTGEFRLSSKECAELFEEGVTYYYRYLHLFQLQDWKRTLRDTRRNRHLFDLAKKYAAQEDDRNYLEQWRPYITRIHAVASAMLKMESNDHDAALAIVQKAIGEIRDIQDIENDTFRYEHERSLGALREMARQIEKTRPLGEAERLEKELQNAVKSEKFERAAELRDQIRGLRATQES